MCLIFLVAAGIVTAIALRIVGVGDDEIDLPGPGNDNVRLTGSWKFCVLLPLRYKSALRNSPPFLAIWLSAVYAAGCSARHHNW